MNVQRVGVRALQQVARPNVFAQNIPRTMLGALQTRKATTTKTTPEEAQALLASQRTRRPVSPHLSAYDFKQTWFATSVWTRITGGGMTAALYLFSISYLAAPLTGWHLESATLASAAGSLSVAGKGALKMAMTWPFVFHLMNACRHLVWDLGKGYKRPVIHAGNMAVWAGSFVGAAGIAYFF
ncbi:succinate dehydrogenase cytochrome b subunit [Xylaria bambusicola]|uniref:succinate dehydrogenase cytochrome b subunit n=1 Tax=Xylaria bambusicola TaxID=326684 RepID=UPI0020083676|nr:succinate dehydrogenase cytochrome b subunit [Xylaria bambusicola]KAI0513328.1 succinate dehydrogenase cytochrome b subunit [Xylaria bambusicola]